MNDVEYALNQKVKDALVAILNHNNKYSVAEQYPDLENLEKEAWNAVNELNKYYSDCL